MVSDTVTASASVCASAPGASASANGAVPAWQLSGVSLSPSSAHLHAREAAQHAQHQQHTALFGGQLVGPAAGGGGGAHGRDGAGSGSSGSSAGADVSAGSAPGVVFVPSSHGNTFDGHANASNATVTAGPTDGAGRSSDAAAKHKVGEATAKGSNGPAGAAADSNAAGDNATQDGFDPVAAAVNNAAQLQ